MAKDMPNDAAYEMGIYSGGTVLKAKRRHLLGVGNRWTGLLAVLSGLSSFFIFSMWLSDVLTGLFTPFSLMFYSSLVVFTLSGGLALKRSRRPKNLALLALVLVLGLAIISVNLSAAPYPNYHGEGAIGNSFVLPGPGGPVECRDACFGYCSVWGWRSNIGEGVYSGGTCTCGC